jgi:hypothetical protein
MKILALNLLVFYPAKVRLKSGERNMTVYDYARVGTDGQTLAAQDAN